jgi:glutamate synthase domain-containing protein 2
MPWKNKEAMRAYNKEYYEKNKEAKRAYRKEYYEKNKEAEKEYYQKNKEYFKEYYEKNKEAYRSRNKEYREKNKEYYKEYREKNKEAIAAYHKEYREKWRSNMDHHRFFSGRLTDCKMRSKKLNIDCTVDTSYLKEIFPTDKKCPALGMPFKVGYKDGISNSPSLDRIDNSKGYIKGNVVWVSMLANMIKSSATPEQIIRVGEFYRQLIGEKE